MTIALFILCFLGSCVQASLFLTEEEKEQALHLQGASQQLGDQKDFPLKVQGIFRRPDLQQWIVWINGHRIDSQSPQSVDGWSIVDVGVNSVTVRSVRGEQATLRLDTGAKAQAPLSSEPLDAKTASSEDLPVQEITPEVQEEEEMFEASEEPLPS